MDSRFKHILIIILVFLFYKNSLSQELNVMSFNIRYDNKNDQENSWDYRKKGVLKLMEKYHPDIIGIQEALFHQIDYIQNNLPNYSYIGEGRDGKNKGEFSAIFYDTTKFKLLNHTTFWLSKTPNKVSKGWDAALPRICTYGLFENKQTKEQLWIFNTHFDHIGNKAKRKSAKLILKKINAVSIKKKPIILLGDLNSIPKSKPITIFNKHLDDALRLSKTPLKGPKGTLNGFNKNKIADQRIDYVFSLHLDILSYTHIEERLVNTNFISDHHPVFVRLQSAVK